MRLLRRVGVAGTAGLDLLPLLRGAIMNVLEEIGKQAYVVLLVAEIRSGVGM
jgi:hypothetical protein